MDELRNHPIEVVLGALEAWAWLDVPVAEPLGVTAFGDVFLHTKGNVWFLDTIEGRCTRLCASPMELRQLLVDPAAREHHLLTALAIEAHAAGLLLGADDTYAFVEHPALGGEVAVGNLVVRPLADALADAGRLHERLRLRS